MKISHLVLCGGLTLALLLSGCADSDTKTTSKKTVPRTTVVTTIIPGEVGTDQNVDGATVTLNGVYRSSITDVHNDPIVQKVDDAGNPVEGAEFSLYAADQVNADGTSLLEGATALQTCVTAITIQSMRATYQQFGQDVEDFSQPIPAGATVTGYIGAEVYEDYQEGVLLYSPLAGGSGDNQDDSKLISYTFHPDDLLDIESAPMQTAMPTESNS